MRTPDFLTGQAAGCALMALVGLAIAANAIMIQDGGHPAPLFETRTATGAAVDPPDGRDRVHRIQRALKRLGYYEGPVDGLPGPATQAAILTFWAETGEAAPGGDLKRIEAELTRVAARLPDRAPLPDPRPDPRVRSVQRALARAAYGPLSTDGLIGPETTDAVRRYQSENGLPATGEIDDALIARLVATGAMVPP